MTEQVTITANARTVQATVTWADYGISASGVSASTTVDNEGVKSADALHPLVEQARQRCHLAVEAASIGSDWPDPTPNVSGDRSCDVTNEASGAVCTLEVKNHRLPHVAGDGDRIVRIWWDEN